MNSNTLNEDIKAWAKDTAAKLKSEQRKLRIKHSAGSNWQRLSYGHSQGLTNRISFKMPRHAIYVHKGVGRGTPVTMVGKTKRKAKHWFNPVIDDNIDDLADKVADNAADLIVNNINIH